MQTVNPTLRLPLLSRILRLLCLGLAAVSLAYAQTDGTVTGQVSNAATGSYLEGAEISVDGTTRTVNTDREGRYSISLPPGVRTIIVRYTGLDIQRIPVNVNSGARTVQDVQLTASYYKMEAFTVAGIREGHAAAITAQREAMNVKNVVASDSFGNIADGNIGDFLQQLPGISAVYVGADVRSVQIRGIDGSLNTVTMDGDQMASSQSAGAGRTFEFEQASLNNIASIEVIKAPTPDMDANSISGSVNIISKSAFDSNVRRSFNYALGGVWRPKYYTRSDNYLREPIDNVGPSVNFSYQDLLGADRRIGVSLTATYHSQPGGDTAALAAYQQTLTEPYYVTSVTIPRPAGAPRTRLATGAKLQYKLSENTVLSLNSSYNWFHESNDTRAMAIGTSAAVGNFRPGYTSFLQEVLPNNNSTSTITLSSDDKSGRTYLLTPTVQHRYPGLEIDYGGSFSNSQTYYEYRPGGDRHFKSRPKATISYNMRGIGFILDRRESVKWPKITPTPGTPDFYNLDNYGTLLVTQPDREGEDEVRSAKLNIRKTLDLPAPTFIKMGGVVREQERSLNNYSRRYNFAGPDGILTTGDERLGQFLDTTGKWSDSNEGYRQPPWANPFAVARHAAENSRQWVEDTAFATTSRLNGDRNITERVSAGYLMANSRLGPLGILAGVRVEKTETDANGPATVNGVLTRINRKGKYTDVFPGVHFRWVIAPNLIGRLTYNSSIGRPSFENLMPADTINEVAQTVNIRNTELLPQYSDSIEATLEYYFQSTGKLSANVFRKYVRDFQFSDSSQFVGTGPDNGFGGLYEGFRITTARNGGDAVYEGFELEYAQQFTFLPSFWRGFGFVSNYTFLKTEGNYGTPTVTSQVAGFVPKIGNVALTYRGQGFNIRLNGVWRDTYLITNSTNPALVVWQEPKFQVNVKTRYDFSPKLGVFCDIENLNKSPITERYTGTKDRPTETRIVVAKVVAGITGRF